MHWGCRDPVTTVIIILLPPSSVEGVETTSLPSEGEGSAQHAGAFGRGHLPWHFPFQGYGKPEAKCLCIGGLPL